MRIASLVFSFVVTISMLLAGLIYLEGRIGQQRIQVQDAWLASTDSADQSLPVALGRLP
jgi:hypothetical protein